MTKEQIDEFFDSKKDGSNLFPKGTTDKEFVDFVSNYFLGNDWFTVDPISREQVNTEVLYAIVNYYKPKRAFQD